MSWSGSASFLKGLPQQLQQVLSGSVQVVLTWEYPVCSTVLSRLSSHIATSPQPPGSQGELSNAANVLCQGVISCFRQLCHLPSRYHVANLATKGSALIHSTCLGQGPGFGAVLPTCPTSDFE